MPFICVGNADKPTSRLVCVWGGLLRAILLFGPVIAILGFVLASLLLVHEDSNFDHTHFTITIDPVITGTTRPNTQLF